MALQILQSAIPVGILASTKGLIDVVVASTSQTAVGIAPAWESGGFYVYTIALSGLFLFQASLQQIIQYIQSVHHQKVVDQMVGDILKKATTIPYPFFEDPSYHDSLHLAQKQAMYKLPQLYQHFQSLFIHSLGLIFLIGYFFDLMTEYALLIVLVTIPLALVKWFNSQKLHQLEKALIPLERQSTYLHTVLTDESKAKEIRTIGFGQSFIARFKAIRQAIYQKRNKLQRRFMGFSLLAEILEAGVLFWILFSIGKDVISGLVQVSILVVMLQGLQKVQGNLKSFLLSVVQLVQQRLFLNDLYQFLEYDGGNELQRQSRDVELKDGYSPKKAVPEQDERESTAIEEGLIIRNLSFSYPNTTTFQMEGISLELKKGQMVGIVGVNGAGKSTLVKLVSGLYSPSRGEIRYNGKLLSDIPKKELRKKMTVLFQDFERYYIPIDEIISLGSDEKSVAHPDEREKKLRDALLAADALDFVTAMPQGINSKLGRMFRDGHQLSGGQWQKLAIARAHYSNSEIIILDEPTSALDLDSEFKIFENLRSTATDKITLLITHRLYNLRNVDHIVVMEEGRIKEQGGFKELMNSGGDFSSLYRKHYA